MAASFGFAALGSGADALASSARTRVRYWNLFSGGDGGNTVAMVDAFHRADPDVAVGLPGTWTDHGKAFTSEKTDTWNAIDPAVIHADGKLWMAFGSYWTGIRMVQLDRRTGKALPDAPVHHLATRPDAPYAGVNSTYKIRVGRSTSITGPYVDSTGTPMLNGGGDLLLSGHGRYIGPGGESTFRTHGKTWPAYHYYDATDNGTPKPGLNKLGWSKEGWPKFF
ncbi:arabinan endo-1,5-alpha-L-arabinosidase [Streptomyces sp. NPDC058755]|uniref:arabinan endo-1,5-alpha-L-arabinosidase n=1 Tax=Streptomyces sp. NPDC058755 TaxID=3346624 RepID=UPI0036A8D991